MFENNRIDRRQEYFPEYIERPTLIDAPPCTTWYIDSDALLMDECGKARIDTGYPLQQLHDAGIINCRTIIYEEWIAVDHTKSLDIDPRPYTFFRASKNKTYDEYISHDFDPVIGIIATKKDSKIINILFNEKYSRDIKERPSYSLDSNNKDKSSKYTSHL